MDDEQDPDLWRKQRIEDEMGLEEKPRRFIQPDPHPEYSRLDRLDGLGAPLSPEPTQPAEVRHTRNNTGEGEPTSSGAHQKVLMYGEIEVCDTCLNSLGYNIRWDQAPCRGSVRETSDMESAIYHAIETVVVDQFHVGVVGLSEAIASAVLDSMAPPVIESAVRAQVQEHVAQAVRLVKNGWGAGHRVQMLVDMVMAGRPIQAPRTDTTKDQSLSAYENGETK